jgi:hypothetical protein
MPDSEKAGSDPESMFRNLTSQRGGEEPDPWEVFRAGPAAAWDSEAKGADEE